MVAIIKSKNQQTTTYRSVKETIIQIYKKRKITERFIQVAFLNKPEIIHKNRSHILDDFMIVKNSHEQIQKLNPNMLICSIISSCQFQIEKNNVKVIGNKSEEIIPLILEKKIPFSIISKNFAERIGKIQTFPPFIYKTIPIHPSNIKSSHVLIFAIEIQNKIIEGTAWIFDGSEELNKNMLILGKDLIDLYQIKIEPQTNKISLTVNKKNRINI